MKIQTAVKRTGAMTLVEAVVVIFVIVVLGLVLLPALVPHHSTRQHTSCVNNLKQIALSFRIWEGDNGGKFPMQVSVTNGGVMELIGKDNAYLMWQTMSNELSTPKVSHCPADTEHIAATNFSAGFSDANISYFFNPDASDNYPQMILIGDDNLAVNGVRVPSGILSLQTNASVAWTQERHHGTGNIGLADGSVQSVTSAGLSAALVNSGTATNRLVIP